MFLVYKAVVKKEECKVEINRQYTIDDTDFPLELSVIIPVYHAEESLPVLYQRLTFVLKNITQRYEIIFVEDCSKDKSWSVIARLAESDPHIQALKMARNSGQHNAVLAGIRAARGELSITMDDDLQNPPEEIPRLLENLTSDIDVVYGTPDKERHGLLRNFASQITKISLQESMGARTARKVSAFRLIRTRLRGVLASYKNPMVNIDVLLTWSTDRFTAVTVRHDKREIGKSGYTFGKLITHAFNMITGFSTVPLQISSVMGFLFSTFGMFILIYVSVRYLVEGTAVPGFSFLASIIAIFSGVQLFAIGLIGEYLARMHFRTLEKPTYVIQKTVIQNISEKTKDE